MRPGTVSKILWHFTGGLMWDQETNKQLDKLKPTKDGFDALKSILDSREIRVGSYKEVVKVVVPERITYKRIKGTKTRERIVEKNLEYTLYSSPVCCVADIPIQHLAYHSKRYGKIAIGFRREAVINAGFNPVMYSMENSNLVNLVHDGIEELSNITADNAQSAFDDYESDVEGLFRDEEIDFTSPSNWVEAELDNIVSEIASVKDNYKELLAYIKTFDETEFDSIYCEREWRSTSPFSFNLSDLAFIILPRNDIEGNFYKDFLDNHVDSLKIPKEVIIASWEDLIEH